MRNYLFILAFSAALMYSCIKPYACECEYVKEQPVKKSHILIYANKQNKQESCEKHNKDSTVVCRIKE
jgi:hypothetical protein